MAHTGNITQQMGCEWAICEEQMLADEGKEKHLVIGIPNEVKRGENRVCITPESALNLHNQGYSIIVQRGAGLGANYTDAVYSDCGAQVVSNIGEVYTADIIVKSTTITHADAMRMKEHQIVFSPVEAMVLKKDAVTELMRKRVTAFGFNLIKDEEGNFPFAHIMSEIAGSEAIMVAGEYLSRTHGGRGVLLGGISGITPTEIMILGGNTLGEYAARAAKGLGATVKIFDHSINRLRELRGQLGQSLYTSVFHVPVLEKALRTADVVIGTLNCLDRHNAFLVSEEQIKLMKPGAVILDLAISHGGCFETSRMTTHENPVYEHLGILHYCVPNILSRVSKTASIAYSNVFSALLSDVMYVGDMKSALCLQKGLREGLYIYQGLLTHEFIAKKYGLIWRDVNQLFSI